MGCSAAKNLTVEPLDGTNSVTAISNGTLENGGGSKRPSAIKLSDVPPLEGIDPQTEFLENGIINNVHQTSELDEAENGRYVIFCKQSRAGYHRLLDVISAICYTFFELPLITNEVIAFCRRNG